MKKDTKKDIQEQWNARICGRLSERTRISVALPDIGSVANGPRLRQQQSSLVSVVSPSSLTRRRADDESSAWRADANGSDLIIAEC